MKLHVVSINRLPVMPIYNDSITIYRSKFLQCYDHVNYILPLERVRWYDRKHIALFSCRVELSGRKHSIAVGSALVWLFDISQILCRVTIPHFQHFPQNVRPSSAMSFVHAFNLPSIPGVLLPGAAPSRRERCYWLGWTVLQKCWESSVG